MAKSEKDKDKKRKPLKPDTTEEDVERLPVLFCPDHEDDMALDDANCELSPVCGECGGTMVREVRTVGKDEANKLRAKKYKKEKD